MSKMSRGETPEARWQRIVGRAPTASVYEPVLLYYPRLKRVMSFAQENLTEPIRLADAAEVACLSPKYFSHYFKTRVGIRFADWLNGLRIERAKQLLAEQYLGVSQVALEVGFRDVRTFQRRFVSVCGVTPSTYRNRQERQLREQVTSPAGE